MMDFCVSGDEPKAKLAVVSLQLADKNSFVGRALPDDMQTMAKS